MTQLAPVSGDPFASSTGPKFVPVEHDPFAAPTAQPATPDWKDVPGLALQNAPSSAVELGRSIAQPFIHPVDTAQSLYQIGRGAVSKAEGLAGVEQAPDAKAQNEAAINAVGQFFAQRYGGIDALKKTMATDPVGFLADAATVLTGGETALARAPGIVGKIGEVAGTTGRAIDPITNAMKATAATTKAAGHAASYPLALTTGVAPINIQTAAKAGAEGNKTFAAQMRGTGDISQPVEMADAALKKVAQDRADAYRTTMAGVKASTKTLDLAPIRNSLLQAENKVVYRGVPKSQDALGTYNELKSLVDTWEAQPPQMLGRSLYWPHRTAEGLDALKQAVGEVRNSTEFGSLSRSVADDVYSSIKKEIVKQSPSYAKAMDAYSAASDNLKELRKTFSLGENATSDTSLRKLHSIMRDNVGTNYGARAKLGEKLTKEQPNLPYAIAGQTMSSWLPRGLSRALAGAEVAGGGLGAAVGIFHPAILAALAASSPRVVGEGAHLAGQVAKLLRKTVTPGRAQTVFQAGRAAKESGK